MESESGGGGCGNGRETKKQTHLWVTWRYLSDNATRHTSPNTHNIVSMATHDRRETADCSSDGGNSGTSRASYEELRNWAAAAGGSVPLVAS